MKEQPVIAIITDFGTQDPFVGIMKGVIAQIAPEAKVIDLTHEIPPGDIQRAGIQLWQAKSYFPPDTIFLGVVDPGVGTYRKGLVARQGDYLFVGPDNGLFSFVLEPDATIYSLSAPSLQLKNPSSTFHGRDIFAPAAAHLANGTALIEFGNLVPDPIQSPEPVLYLQTPTAMDPLSTKQRPVGEQSIVGEILFSDRFGNLVTSLGKVQKAGQKAILSPWIQASSIEVVEFNTQSSHLLLPGERTVRWVKTFADIPPGELGAFVGSSGLIEIAAQGTSASEQTGFRGKEKIVLKFI